MEMLNLIWSFRYVCILHNQLDRRVSWSGWTETVERNWTQQRQRGHFLLASSFSFLKMSFSPLDASLTEWPWSLLSCSQTAIRIASWRKRVDTVPCSGHRGYRSPGEGDGYPLWHCCLKNSMDSGAWRATVHGVAKCRTRLSANTRRG